jgi:hypothetical protein
MLVNNSQARTIFYDHLVFKLILLIEVFQIIFISWDYLLTYGKSQI